MTTVNPTERKEVAHAQLPDIPELLRLADAELGLADQPPMLSVQLTKTEHMLVIQALGLLRGQSRGLNEGQRLALDSVTETFAENVAEWDDLLTFLKAGA